MNGSSSPLDLALDFLTAHPLGSWIGYGVLVVVAVVLGVLLDGRGLYPPEPLDFGTGDMGRAARRHERVAEGGYRPAGDPGPRRIGGRVDEASGQRRPV